MDETCRPEAEDGRDTRGRRARKTNQLHSAGGSRTLPGQGKDEARPIMLRKLTQRLWRGRV